MTTTVDRILREARSHLGYDEGPNNSTKFGRWYGMDHQPWCAIWISYIADQVHALDIIPKHAYTPSGANWFKARKQWHTPPKRGDIVYYEFPGMGRISHVGIVEAVHSDGSITAIEGNTNAAGSRTGGSVLRKRRPRSLVAGYGRPEYVSERKLQAMKAAAAKKIADAKRKAAAKKAAASRKKKAAIAAAALAAAAAAVVIPAATADGPSPKPTVSPTATATARPSSSPKATPKASPKPTAKPKPKPQPAAKPYVLRRVLIQGASGGDVRRMQAVVGVPRAQRDGQMGPSTVRYVKRWQRSKRLTPDGAFGKASAKKAGWTWTRSG